MNWGGGISINGELWLSLKEDRGVAKYEDIRGGSM